VLPNVRMIIDLDIRQYRHLLMGETDPAKRRTITYLLVEEEGKLAGLPSEESKISPRATRAIGRVETRKKAPNV
jgi:hypothetical protein